MWIWSLFLFLKISYWTVLTVLMMTWDDKMPVWWDDMRWMTQAWWPSCRWLLTSWHVRRGSAASDCCGPWLTETTRVKPQIRGEHCTPYQFFHTVYTKFCTRSLLYGEFQQVQKEILFSYLNNVNKPEVIH